MGILGSIRRIAEILLYRFQGDREVNEFVVNGSETRKRRRGDTSNSVVRSPYSNDTRKRMRRAEVVDLVEGNSDSDEVEVVNTPSSNSSSPEILPIPSSASNTTGLSKKKTPMLSTDRDNDCEVVHILRNGEISPAMRTGDGGKRSRAIDPCFPFYLFQPSPRNFQHPAQKKFTDYRDSFASRRSVQNFKGAEIVDLEPESVANTPDVIYMEKSPSRNRSRSLRGNIFRDALSPSAKSNDRSGVLSTGVSEKRVPSEVDNCRSPLELSRARFSLRTDSLPRRSKLPVASSTPVTGFASKSREATSRELDNSFNGYHKMTSTIPVHRSERSNDGLSYAEYSKRLNLKIQDGAKERAEKIRAVKEQTHFLEKQNADVQHALHLSFRIRQKLVIVEEEETEEEGIDVADQLAPLSQKAEAAISEAFGSRSSSNILSEKFSIQIRWKDINTLAPGAWLNDEVINFYLNMIVERSESGGDRYPSVFAHQTFFYSTLASRGYQAVRRWTRRVDIFEKEIILIPVHLQIHWTIAVVDMKLKVVSFLDSMGSQRWDIVDTILDYLKQEMKDKKNEILDVSEWKKEIPKVPQQMNGSDCGMFACKFGDYLSRRAKITLSQSDMPYFRRRMVWEILNKTFYKA
ncbi:unnamed protein product [Notodromas monacha]|uniref:Ubiquitin-like protease family profile domain-containing protein n=1 Tax=Notodromas monacha TaxID=399045 RepID=A0A7R9BRF8_9CRUS|nr:unnamed protein product [Notodromas monacha]CAG0918793.1 unnamed protein product [Notodromas monacha]